MNYSILPQEDYKKKIKYRKNEFRCYSKKQLKERYPNKDYKVVGETKYNNKKEALGTLRAGGETYSVSQVKSNSRILWAERGYAAVGKDSYVVLLKSRIPFLLILFGLLIGFCVCLALLIRMLVFGPPDVPPLHPLPGVDSYVESMTDDPTIKNPTPAEGGGSVAMIYQLKASLSLSSGQIGIYFKNPNASNHDVAVQLYIVSGDKEILIAESGLIEAGYSLNRLDMIENAATLQEGLYEGKFKVIYYNPETGERALVESDINDVLITVTE